MEFTGERYIPGAVPADLAPRIHLEHVHRYALAAELVTGSVLDLASGVGYGSDLLAARADRVVALDRDLAATFYSARNTSERGHVECAAGDACAIPFASASFDWVICFEAIEHVGDGPALVAEASRVLKSSGTLMISSPIPSEYGRTYPSHTNPFHVKEYEVDELIALLGAHFRQVVLLGQRLFFGSAIWPLKERIGEAFRVLSSPPGDAIAFQRAPLYSVALCTNTPVISTPTSSLLAGRLEALLDGLIEAICSRYEAEISRRDRSAVTTLAEARSEVAELSRQLAELRASRIWKLGQWLRWPNRWFGL